jgi:hypothetical protein
MTKENQMRNLFPLTSRVFCAGIGVLFVVLTAVFVLVPYALEGHPWEPAPSAAAVAKHHTG